MRAIWTGSLSFGLVNIPVKLYGAAMERTLSFKLLNRHDLSPIKYQKVSEDNHVIQEEDIARGYDLNGHYVLLDEEDFKRAGAMKAETIDIVQFTDPQNIAPIFYDKPYYIEPEKNASKAYALLRDALNKSGKVAIARYVLRDKEHIGAISVEGKVMLLEQLHYQDEIRDTRDLHSPQKGDYSEREMDLALDLIKSQTHEFDPKEYHDTYADELRRVISEKAKGRKIKIRRAEPVEATDVSEILEMLKKSLQKAPSRS